MALILKDRIKESTTITGTGDVSLGGSSETFDTFQSVMSNGDTTFYAIVTKETGVDEWEVGLGTFNTGNTLTRTTVYAGSNGTSAVNFSSGDKDIFISYPASKAVVAGEDITFADITVTGTVDGRDIAADGTKLDGIEASADVTDTTNVTAAGALMDSEVTNLAQVKAFDSSDYATAAQGATADAALPKSGGTMTGNLILNADPTTAFGAATKEYVDTIAAAGIHYHTPVRVESPSALTATYDNGTSGVGATLTNSGTQAALVIDGVTLSTSDRVLVYNQTNAAHNGIYTVTNTGSASTNWVLTRATDADSYGASDPDAMGEGDAFFVKEGDTGAGELYVMNTSGTITFGTTNITFTVIAETAVYSAGTGMSIDGTTFSTVQDISTTASPTFNNITVTGTVDGRDVATDGSKLDGIEAGATADQTAAEIKTAYESNSDTNAFTDAEQTKLSGIETGATGDQTASEILTAIKTVDGTGSGLDADTLDGNHASAFLTAHPNISAASSSDNSGRTYIQDITLDSNGHVTSIATATETVTNTNTNQLTTFQVEDGDGTEVTISHGKEWKFVEAGGININWTDTSTGSDGDPYDMSFSINTSVTAGDGLAGGGTLNQDRNLRVGEGSGITVSANEVSHSDTSTLSGVYGSATTGTKIHNITVDEFGHVTAITTGATGSMSYFNVQDNGGTQVSVSNGEELNFIDGNATTVEVTDQNNPTVQFNHADTSSQASSNNSGGTVIQDITLDTYGHVTGLGTVNHDNNYIKRNGDTVTYNGSQSALTLQDGYNSGAKKSILKVENNYDLAAGIEIANSTGYWNVWVDTLANNNDLVIGYNGLEDFKFTEFGDFYVDRDIYVGRQIVHDGDTNTYIQFGSGLGVGDEMSFYAGGKRFFSLIEGGTDYLSLNVDPYFQTKQVVFGDPTDGTVNDTTLQRGTTTADRTITLPDATGTVALTSDLYTDSDVDTHLNTSTATTSELLSWDGSDYYWRAETNTTSLPIKNSALSTQFTSSDITGLAFEGSGATSISFNSTTRKVTISSTDTNTTYSNATTSAAGLMSSTDKTKLDGIEASADVTDTANVTAAGALMDSECTSLASVKALDQGVATTDSPSFSGLTVDGYTLQDSTDRSGLLALTTGLGTWKGIQIQPTTTSKWSIMGDQDDFGLYDDQNNEWIMLYNENGSLQLYSNGSNPVTVTTTGLKLNANDYITYEGSTNNTFETFLKVEDPTADRTITLPNATGTVWTSGNDGSGSGLDADLLDGQQGSYYLDYNNLTNTPSAGGGSVALTAGIANFIGR